MGGRKSEDSPKFVMKKSKPWGKKNPSNPELTIEGWESSVVEYSHRMYKALGSLCMTGNTMWTPKEQTVNMILYYSDRSTVCCYM